MAEPKQKCETIDCHNTVAGWGNCDKSEGVVGANDSILAKHSPTCNKEGVGAIWGCERYCLSCLAEAKGHQDTLLGRDYRQSQNAKVKAESWRETEDGIFITVPDWRYQYPTSCKCGWKVDTQERARLGHSCLDILLARLEALEQVVKGLQLDEST